MRTAVLRIARVCSLTITIAIIGLSISAAPLAHAQAPAGFCAVNQAEPANLDLPAVPLVEFFTNLIGPVALLISVLNLAFAVPLVNVVRLTQAFFLPPLFAFSVRRRHGYMIVYESLSKKPVDLALVRVINDETDRVIATRVSDADGRMYVIAPPGRYRFTVVKRGHDFPSKFLAGERFDENYGQIYTGRPIELKESGPLDVGLPLDAPEDRVSVSQAIWRVTRRSLHAGFAYTALIVSALSAVVAWTWQAWGLLALQLLLFFIFLRLTYKPVGRPWGRVSDQSSGSWLNRTVVRILDPRFNRVLETVVTDRDGKYGFIVGKSRYQLYADRPTYERFSTEPFEVEKRPGVVFKDIEMRRHEPGSNGTINR